MSNKPPDIKTACEMWDAWSGVVLRAADQLRKKVSITEIEFRRLAHTASGKAREVYFYRSLDEVQKAVFAMLHWREFFTGLEDEKDPETHLNRVILEETMDNQSFRCRKLMELLVELILFQHTNSAPYYRDYLLIRDLNEHADAQRDRTDFYGHENRNTAESMKFFFSEIRRNEANLDSKKRWYLEKSDASKPTWEIKGARLSTFKARYIRAIKICEPVEFICLGKSYLHAYGVSREVHFSPNDTSSSFSVKECLLLGNRCLLLAQQCFIRLASLIGVSSEGFVQTVAAWNELDKENLSMVREISEEKHAVGDYVIAHGDPSRLIEVKKSGLGFIAYQVEYLGRAPMPHIKRDWFAAFELRRFMPKTLVEAKVNQMLATLPVEAQPTIARLREPTQWLKHLDEGALATWNAFRTGKLKPPLPPSISGTEPPVTS